MSGILTTAGNEITKDALDAAIVEIVLEDAVPIHLNHLGHELQQRGMFPKRNRLVIFDAIWRGLKAGSFIKVAANTYARPDYKPPEAPDPMSLLRTEMSLARRKKADNAELKDIKRALARDDRKEGPGEAAGHQRPRVP